MYGIIKFHFNTLLDTSFYLRMHGIVKFQGIPSNSNYSSNWFKGNCSPRSVWRHFIIRFISFSILCCHFQNHFFEETYPNHSTPIINDNISICMIHLVPLNPPNFHEGPHRPNLEVALLASQRKYFRCCLPIVQVEYFSGTSTSPSK